ncbi:MAG: DUF4381 domain-containing protein [Gammaproteobacteria bacterium]|nr:DUF4381 domain-containing protein [Gammaproteobacteria bacterium]
MSESAPTEYEGLNLPQLLDLMHDPVLPEPIAWWPQTPGWWIVLAWIVFVAAAFAWQGYRRYRHNEYRRESLTLLRAIAARAQENPAGVAIGVATLLKRTALAAYPRGQVAQLYGDEWADFLLRTSGHDPAIEQTASQLATAAYRPGVDGTALIEPARRWIEIHRA